MTETAPKTTLADGSPVTEDHRELTASGQQKAYVVLSERERALGFVRPVRLSYMHVGLEKPSNLRDLTPEERHDFSDMNYAGFEEYPEDQLPITGRYWTREEITRTEGCHSVTTMGQTIAETYARDPKFYTSTFCARCKTHRPAAEFVWAGSLDRVGS